eukprot:4845157-Amphidinium_carterae.2
MEIAAIIDDSPVNNAVRSMVMSKVIIGVIGIAIVVMAVYASLRLCQQQLKQQTRGQSTRVQVTNTPDRKGNYRLDASLHYYETKLQEKT